MTVEPSGKLPTSLTPFFWDTDPGGIAPESHRDFVIGRILSAVTLESIRCARSRYGDHGIREWIVRHEGRQLSGPQLRFGQTVIGPPAERVKASLATPERRIWEGAARS